ncbi:MAG: 16S rRNA (guanine(966)-N(2))-methyltransferase RsmD [Clostridiales bacterium]|nr:16S rRNA (guanine(966)-N(2))-methyltransferase RsmD [Candidatus Blautia equi]
MRVIAGKARRLPLKTLPGVETRPTTDRIKETLFNILQPEIPGCRFLDLFSGSGAIAIEAISRGAESAVLVEKNPKACACIRDNLAFTKLVSQGRVLNMDVLQALRSMENRETFDMVFMDPPYNMELERQVLEYLAESHVIDDQTLLVVEADLNTDFSYVDALGYDLLRSKEYKTNKHVFLQRKEGV